MESAFLRCLLPGVLAVMTHPAVGQPGPANLLANPTFEFHAFETHRLGRAVSHTSHNVAFWNTDAWGDITVMREAHAPPELRPPYTVRNLVAVSPGKRLWQFIALPEAGLGHGDRVSLVVAGSQPSPGALRARLRLLKLDSEDGTWKPSDLGMADTREFPRHARGELVTAALHEAQSDAPGVVELVIENVEIIGRFHTDGQSHSADINAIALQVELENIAGEGEAWVWAPCLLRGEAIPAGLGPRGVVSLLSRPVIPYYRHLPRTMQKLWKGEALHILMMGSSIDRGSANPPMYLYDEDPASPTFKQPISERIFEAERVGRPDLEGYVGWWQHYFAQAGRLRLELMRKFNLPVSKLCLNWMAVDGSCVGEAHSGLREYCELSLPPDENLNGHQRGRSWEELYPDLFTRPEGPRPDLVIFGSGANEKTDTPDEVAVFEGMIRWIQRNYPGTEFLFCMWQNLGSYTPNVGDLNALALRYQIPVISYDRLGDDVTRWCSARALTPADGHPQAAAHYLWFKQLEKAFECWEPVVAGQAQLHLPERLHPNSYGWEGDFVTFDATGERLRGGKFVFEDTAINCWGVAEEGEPVPHVNGERLPARRGVAQRDIRNSLFRHGRCRLGDRHILELAGPGARLTYVDAKVCPERRFFPADHPLWRRGDLPVTDFPSEWGAPYGSRQVVLSAGDAVEVDVVATDISVAYADRPEGGTLRVLLDGAERLAQAANVPFVDLEGEAHFMENRRGILGLGYGLHRVRLEAVEGPVAVLGVFTYDARPNRASERRLAGHAVPGETVAFSPAFRARPLVLCHGGLAVNVADITPRAVTFSGDGPGTYEVVGE